MPEEKYERITEQFIASMINVGGTPEGYIAAMRRAIVDIETAITASEEDINALSGEVL